MFQILEGSWTSPDAHTRYAQGNALIWAELLPYRKVRVLPHALVTLLAVLVAHSLECVS